MARDTLAPWADTVLHTADDLAALTDDGWRYELVQGRLVRMPPTGFEHSSIARALFLSIDRYVDAHALGQVTMPETGFFLRPPANESQTIDRPDTILAPDLAFIAAARIPRPGQSDWKGFPRVAPGLVIEIASPSQYRPEMAAKVRLWLEAGVRLAWVVWPETRQIDVWMLGADLPATLGMQDELAGEDVLPGFRCPVARIFPGVG
jgi:Uma2 family endonuclease